MIFVISPNICSGYSLELPRRSNSVEYSQHMFLWRTIENYLLIITKYLPFLFYCRIMGSARKVAFKYMWMDHVECGSETLV